MGLVDKILKKIDRYQMSKQTKEIATQENIQGSLLTLAEASISNKEDVISKLETDSSRGLSPATAANLLDKYGPNELTEEKKESFFIKLLNQFKDFMIIVLIVAAVISGALGEMLDAIVILAVVIVNALLGVYQEGKAERAIEALQKMAAPEAHVIRDGKLQVITAAELVPGDLVQLEAGNVVPADIRLIQSKNMQADESALTGESVPVDKAADFISNEVLGIGDRKNVVYSSTAITYGRGVGIVVATGQETEMGRIASSLTTIKQEQTPLQQNLNRLGKVLGILALIVSAVIFGVGLLQGGDPLQLFMTAVALAVAAIPEGLPAVVTIVLSLGMNRMAKENAIVKRLLAVETLGSVDTICSDKTGTLTQNEMTVTKLYADNRVFNVSGTGYAPDGEINSTDDDNVATSQDVLDRLFEIGILCNDAVLRRDDGEIQMIGDPTEGALLAAAGKGCSREVSVVREENPRADEKPFDSARKMMSVAYTTLPDAPYISLTKGAPDRILDRSNKELTTEGVIDLTKERRREITAMNSSFARSALRVLAFAYRHHESEKFECMEEDMIFVGLMGMIDPARPEAKESIRVCHEAGIRVVMITGDHKETAVAIANDLNLRQEDDKVLSGTDLDKMTVEELQEVSEYTSVYARVSPENKVQIVDALKAKGHISSMTGDGVNDAPALKRADIGVAMGITGTEVAKTAADMILTDDNFSTIVRAVEEGRVIYSNIRKVVSFLLSCNVGEILVIFITNMILGPEYTPLMPIQLLWLNLVTDSFPALALGQERAEEGIMKLPPRRADAKILDKEMKTSIAVQATAILLTVFAAFNLGRIFYPDVYLHSGMSVANFSFMPLANTQPSMGAHTYAFICLILAELVRAYSSRSERHSVFSLGVFSNATLNKAIIISVALTLAVVYLPFMNDPFYTIPLQVFDWGMILTLVLIPFAAGEIFKKLYHRNDREKESA